MDSNSNNNNGGDDANQTTYTTSSNSLAVAVAVTSDESSVESDYVDYEGNNDDNVIRVVRSAVMINDASTSTNIVTAQLVHAEAAVETAPSAAIHPHYNHDLNDGTADGLNVCDGDVFASCRIVQQEEPTMRAIATTATITTTTPLLASAAPLSYSDPLNSSSCTSAVNEDISPYLMELLQLGKPIGDDVTYGYTQNWINTIMDTCANHPEQTWYISPYAQTKRTTLHEACLLFHKYYRDDFGDVLLQILNANPNAVCQVDGGGNTPLHLLFPPFHYSGGAEEEEEEKERETVRVVTSFIQTSKMFQMDIACQPNNNGETSLHLACRNNYDELLTPGIVSLLLSSSPFVSIARMRDKCGLTPLASYCSLLSTTTEQKRQLRQEESISSKKRRKNRTIKIINILLQQYPQALYEQDSTGYTPLFYPAMSAHSLLVQTLLDFWNICDDGGGKKYHCNDIGDEKGEKCWPSSSFIFMKNNRGYNALHAACTYQPRSNNNKDDDELQNHLNVLRLLVEALPASSLTQVDKYKKQSPLHVLCECGMLLPESLYILLGVKQEDNISIHGKRVAIPEAITAASMVDSSGYTPLHYACRRSNHYHHHHLQKEEVIRTLIKIYPKATSLPSKKHGEDTPLHLAAENGTASYEIIQLLIESYPHALKMKNAYGYTPLHCAARANFSRGTGSISTAAAAANRSQEEEGGDASIKYSRDGGSITVGGDNDGGDAADIIRLLVDTCPDSLWMKTNGGETPLHLACQNGNVQLDVVRALLEGLSDCSNDDNSGVFDGVDVVQDEGKYKLDSASACFAGAHSSRERTRRRKRRISPKATASSSIERMTMVNKVGNTPLHEACFRRSSVGLIHLLATSHPQWITQLNDMGYTPLHLAVKAGMKNVDVIRALLDANVPSSSLTTSSFPVVTSIADKSGHLPLHSACHAGSSTDVIRLLICVYPDALSSTTNRGDTPIHLAVFRNAPIDTIRLLVEHTRLMHENDISLIKSDDMREEKRTTPLLWRNDDGRTVLDVLMDQYRRCCSRSDEGGSVIARDKAVFVISAIGYSASGCDFLRTSLKCSGEDRRMAAASSPAVSSSCSCPILHAALSIGLHSDHDIIDESLIRSIIKLFPEQICIQDKWGNYPLHIEAGLPIAQKPFHKKGKHNEVFEGDKGPIMPLGAAGAQMRRSLQYQIQHQKQQQQAQCADTRLAERIGLLDTILEAFPNAAKKQNSAGDFPLSILASSGRSWGGIGGIKSVLAAYPPALCWDRGVSDSLFPLILSKMGQENDRNSFLWILRSKPDLVDRR